MQPKKPYKIEFKSYDLQDKPFVSLNNSFETEEEQKHCEKVYKKLVKEYKKQGYHAEIKLSKEE